MGQAVLGHFWFPRHSIHSTKPQPFPIEQEHALLFFCAVGTTCVKPWAVDVWWRGVGGTVQTVWWHYSMPTIFPGPIDLLQGSFQTTRLYSPNSPQGGVGQTVVVVDRQGTKILPTALFPGLNWWDRKPPTTLFFLSWVRFQFGLVWLPMLDPPYPRL